LGGELFNRRCGGWSMGVLIGKAKHGKRKEKKNTFMKHCEQMGFNTQEALMAY